MLETCRGKGKVKGKAVPLQSCSDPESSTKLMFQDFLKTAQDGVKVVSRTSWALFPPRKYSWYSFGLRLRRPLRKDFMSMKNQMISAGIEPATFRFLASTLNTVLPAVPFPLWDSLKLMVICTFIIQALRLCTGLTAHKRVEVYLYSFLTTALRGVRV